MLFFASLRVGGKRSYFLRHIRSSSRQVAIGAEALAVEALRAPLDVLGARRGTKDRDVGYVVAVVIAGRGPVAVRAEGNGREAGCCALDVPRASRGTKDRHIGFAIAVEISRRSLVTASHCWFSLMAVAYETRVCWRC